MPVTQREFDIMVVESQLRISRLFQEWRRSFLKDRLPEMNLEDDAMEQLARLALEGEPEEE